MELFACQHARFADAVEALGEALWAERSKIRWYLVIMACIGSAVGVYGWSMRFIGLAEFGVTFAWTSLAALSALRYIEWRRDRG